MTAAPQNLFDAAPDCPDCFHYKRLADGASCRARYWYVALPQGTDTHFPECKFFKRKEPKNG